MLKDTKIVVIVLLVLINSFSGCTLFSFFDETEFLLNSSVIEDDDGFTSLFLHFNTTDKATLKMLDPSGDLLFFEEYYAGAHDEIVPLDEYRKTPSLGRYHLKAYDTNEKKIFENELFFTGQNLTITKVIEKWWLNDDKYFLVGLTITLKNSGDLPAYPHTATVQIDNKKSSGFLLPAVILPHQSKNVNCFVYLDDISTESSLLELSVNNFEGEILADTIITIHPSENIPDLEYSWGYNGDNTLVVPDVDFLYEYYSSLERLVLEDYAAYVFDVYDDQYIDLVAERLLALTDASDNVGIINFAASFIQSLKYAKDDENDPTYEYPRYPIETVKDSQGDCEDKAMLTASLLDSMGYTVSLLRLPNHMAVGVHLDENLSNYDCYAEEYYYLETTRRDGGDLGRVPEEYEDITNVTVHSISSRPILIHSWKNATRFSGSDGSDYVKIKILIENLGRGNANNFEIRGAFYNQNGIGFNKETTWIVSLAAGKKKVVDLQINVPQGISTTLKTQIYLNDQMVHEKESTSSFP